MSFKQYVHISDNKDSILKDITDVSRKYLIDRIKRFVISLGKKNYSFDIDVESHWVGQKVKVLVTSSGQSFDALINPLFFSAENAKNYFKEIEIAIKQQILGKIKEGGKA